MPFRFQTAAKQAAASYGADVWISLSATEQSNAIYRELRKLDADFLKSPKVAKNSSSQMDMPSDGA